jgi:hypothetical protein
MPSRTRAAQSSRSARLRLENARRSYRSSLSSSAKVRIGAADFPDPVLHLSPDPAFDLWLVLMRATTASNAVRTRASSKVASATICAFRIESPIADGAICRAARWIFRAVARARVIGIASPCLSALRLERALPAAVLGPRLRAPLRRLAAICLPVAILMLTIGGYR